ncbi:hypothetical protein BC939DRAFT_532013 [Gamsiella multidivaricata]|uniref:uncharacterized protein n=1 Tax=Gamsiella multidivaricata TaxID=101098 RepID=UPI00221F71D3|nr:uncharacterized protein BC939DRAFT_532013 [Gamsiella multidivaricata]KAG0349588.1 hypothetical protein BGZ54_004316 [Gamsiella multidivaricata]KAI7818378.1 hypothetical protein BC939DRAFT_532013 [Gamsiella multidivaricata]
MSDQTSIDDNDALTIKDVQIDDTPHSRLSQDSRLCPTLGPTESADRDSIPNPVNDRISTAYPIQPQQHGIRTHTVPTTPMTTAIDISPHSIMKESRLDDKMPTIETDAQTLRFSNITDGDFDNGGNGNKEVEPSQASILTTPDPRRTPFSGFPIPPPPPGTVESETSIDASPGPGPGSSCSSQVSLRAYVPFDPQPWTDAIVEHQTQTIRNFHAIAQTLDTLNAELQFILSEYLTRQYEQIDDLLKSTHERIAQQERDQDRLQTQMISFVNAMKDAFQIFS